MTTRTTDSTPATDTVETLRAELFATLRELRAGTVEIATARAVSDIAQTIINTARAQIDAARALGRNDGLPSHFLAALPTPAAPQAVSTPSTTKTSGLTVKQLAPGHRSYKLGDDE